MAVGPNPDDPYGYAFGPTRPSRGPQLHPGDYGFVKSVASYLGPDRGSAAPPGTPVEQMAPHGGLMQYLRDTAASFDPRTFEGLVNWAATFYPGPGGKGGRVVGKMTKAQLELMKNLHNVQTYKQPEWFLESVRETNPELADKLERSSQYQFFPKAEEGPYMKLGKKRPNQGVKQLADVFGMNTASPQTLLESGILGHSPRVNSPGDLMKIQARLGTHGTKPPWWVVQGVDRSQFHTPPGNVSESPHGYIASDALVPEARLRNKPGGIERGVRPPGAAYDIASYQDFLSHKLAGLNDEQRVILGLILRAIQARRNTVVPPYPTPGHPEAN